MGEEGVMAWWCPLEWHGNGIGQDLHIRAICPHMSFYFILVCSYLIHFGFEKVRVLGFWKYVQCNKQTIMEITQVLGMSTMHSFIGKKIFVGSHFWKKEIHLLLCLKIWDVTPLLPRVA
jgi:hypothetical protein